MAKVETASSDTASSKLKIFVSYARRDLGFADTIVAALEGQGFEVLIDRRDLPYGEEWQKELEDFIRASDTVLWLVSPDSVKSDWCHWELGLVGQLNKRLIPLLIRETPPKSLPKAIGKIHLLPADGCFSLDAHLPVLVETLNADRAWLKEGTLLGQRAREWLTNERKSSMLLRGPALTRAETWKTKTPAAEEPPKAVLDLILESRRAATRRQRGWLAGSVTLTAAALALAGFAYLQRDLAIENEATAKENLAEAQVTQTLFWSDLAEQQLEEGDPETAGLLSLEALGDQANEERPFRAQPVRHLYKALGTSREAGLFKGHTKIIGQVAFSPDGTRLLTVSNDGTGRIWDVESGKTVATLKGHSGPVFQGVFTPDGKRAITLSQGGTARVWDVKTGEEVAVVRTFGGDVRDLAIGPDGELFATASGGNYAIVWDVQTGKEVARLMGHEEAILSLDFSPDGTQLLTGSNDKTARIWSARDGEVLAVLKGHRGQLNDAAFDPSGKRVATAAYDGETRIWSAQTHELVHRLGDEDGLLDSHDNEVREVVFSPDGRKLLTLSLDSTARLWDVASGRLLHTFGEHEQPLIGGMFSPDGTYVLTLAGSDPSARLWSAETGKQIAVFRAGEGVPVTAAFSPSGQHLVTGVNHAAHFWDLEGIGSAQGALGDVVRLPHDGPVEAGALSPDGQSVLTFSKNTPVYVWDRKTGAAIVSIRAAEDGRVEAQFSPSGEHVLTVGVPSRTAKIWNPKTGELVAELKDDRSKRKPGEMFGSILAATYDPTGRLIATGHSFGWVRLWDARSASWLRSLRGPKHRTSHLAFSSDGRKLVSVHGESGETAQEVHIWDVDSGEISGRFASDHFINAVSFSPGGNRLVTASADLTARVWDASDGSQIAVMTGHTPGRYHKVLFGDDFYEGLGVGVRDAAFSPDGTLVVTGANDNTARLWSAETGEALSVLEGHIAAVNVAAFHKDGSLILTASQDGEAGLWDIETLERVATLGPHKGGLTHASFSPDGGELLVTSALYDQGGGDLSGEAAVYAIYADVPSIIAAARERATRCLTPDQRKAFFMPAEPPRWCITGPGQTGETDPSQWQPKWPYDSPAWRAWLEAKDRGEAVAMPSP